MDCVFVAAETHRERRHTQQPKHRETPNEECENELFEVPHRDHAQSSSIYVMIAYDDVATSQPFVLSARFAIENRLRETESTARERVEKEKKVGRILRRFWILGSCSCVEDLSVRRRCLCPSWQDGRCRRTARRRLMPRCRFSAFGQSRNP